MATKPKVRPDYNVSNTPVQCMIVCVEMVMPVTTPTDNIQDVLDQASAHDMTARVVDAFVAQQDEDGAIKVLAERRTDRSRKLLVDIW